MERDSKVSFKEIITVRVKREEIFWGKGIHDLLAHIREEHSLKQACEHMQMSYSKGQRIIKRAERELGFEIIHSEKGGSQGGCSQLTEAGEQFFRCYQEFSDAMSEYGTELFKKYFSKYL